jgi:hypothetical protein
MDDGQSDNPQARRRCDAKPPHTDKADIIGTSVTDFSKLLFSAQPGEFGRRVRPPIISFVFRYLRLLQVDSGSSFVRLIRWIVFLSLFAF